MPHCTLVPKGWQEETCELKRGRALPGQELQEANGMLSFEAPCQHPEVIYINKLPGGIVGSGSEGEL